MEWFNLTESKKHDRNCFPSFELLKNRLIIFDLGYFDYQLMIDLIKADAFFLCRLKSNSVVFIKEVVLGSLPDCIGKSLLSCDLSKYHGNVIEMIIEKTINNNVLTCRAIGFWNIDENCYHWYLTNLLVPSKLIYPLYRLRWQIELIFKSCKNSLNANAIHSGNENIIKSLLLGSIAAYLSSLTVHVVLQIYFQIKNVWRLLFNALLLFFHR